MTPASPLPATCDAVVIGAGFYGARLALLLRATGRSVTLLDREPTLLARASLKNQARVHNGYHYPRSVLTSLRSRLNYARFLDEYGECADRSFPHYYAIARGTSKVTAAQFAEFCRRIGAPLAPAPEAVSALFDASRIERVFEVQECGFDALALRARMERDLDAAGVVVGLSTEALRIAESGGVTTVTVRHAGVEATLETELVLNCTYSRLNHLLGASGAAMYPARHELAELALVEPPPELAGAAVTVMDGPFFSLMPYPPRGLFTLSHVRYTPHRGWSDTPDAPPADADEIAPMRHSRFAHMIRDAERYLTAMRSARYVDSLWEIKTLMPRSEQDDSRPILLQRSAELPSCFTVLGAKIDSVYDIEAELVAQLAAQLAQAGVGAP